MKDDTKLEFAGLDAFSKVFADISTDMQAQITERAVREVGKVALDAMQFLAPVRTGTLKRSLGLKTVKYRDNGTAVAVFGPRRGRENWTTSKVGLRTKTNIPTKYAHLVEFGHVDRNGKFIPPSKAFMRPAVDAVAPRAGELMARKVYADLERTAAKHRVKTQ